MTARFKSIPQQGFTLIEMVVALSITTVIFGLGIATYQKFSKSQMVDQAALNLVADLRLTKNKALSGQKPAGWCDDSGEVLSGWKLDLTASGYTILPVCSTGEDAAVFKTVSFPGQVASDTTASILFKILGQGVDGDYSIILSDNLGNSQTIAVTTSGLVNLNE
jgi:prepilin-type N-terminal cleavage/methylation domain-containing protein